MADTIVMPRQGNSVESCLLIRWRVQEGDRVDPKTVVADVETDKASFEVASGLSGTVLKLLATAGDDVPVMQPIAVVGTVGEALPGTAPDKAPVRVDSDEKRSRAVSPRARNLAASRGIDVGALVGTGPGGRVIVRDVEAALQRTLLGGPVTFEDVAVPAPSVSAPGSRSETKIKGVRKVIAERMAQSLATTAQFTLHSWAGAARLQELRARFKASDPAWGVGGITIGDLIAYAVSRTLPRFPAFNAHAVGDSITEFEDVHLGFACDTPRGLMVPVIRNAHRLSLKQISDETKRLAEVCRAGLASADDLAGSTFTLTNLGASGVESFTPILNIPEVAILGVGALVPKAVQKGDQVVFVPSVGLSLTIDHRIVDGAPAAAFLKALGDTIAEVDLVLAR